MKTKSLPFSEILNSFKESFNIGIKHYLIFVFAALIFKAIELALKTTIIGTIITGALSILWHAGYLHVAQKILIKKETPQLKDFFIVFSNQAIIKRLLPAFLLSIGLILISLAIVGLIMGLFYSMVLKSPESVHDYPVWLLSAIPILLLAVAPVPFVFYENVLLLSREPSGKALKYSLQGFFKNALPIILIGVVIIAPAFMMIFVKSFFGLPSAMSKTEEFSLSAFYVAVTPLFATLYYLLYKKIFLQDEPEVIVETLRAVPKPAETPN